MEGLDWQIKATAQFLSGDGLPLEAEPVEPPSLVGLVDELVGGLDGRSDSRPELVLNQLRDALNGLGWALRSAESEWLPPKSS